MAIIIPKLISVELNGYSPIFKDPVNIEIKNNLFIVLGGNGLGKTTILQSIIFGIAGSANENIENDKNKRWGREYFRDRLANPDDAFIIVEFYLGEWLIKLRRGFYSDKILEFCVNGEKIIDNELSANQLFESFLETNAGYNNVKEFNFIIHKLCYLAENRENLAWNLEAQTRILMQIFSDVLVESRFRKQRADIKNLDSKIRHLVVDINKINARIRVLEQPIQTIIDIQPEITKQIEVEDNTVKTLLLQEELIKVNQQISIIRNNYKLKKKAHEKIIEEVEELRNNLAAQEHAFFFDALNQIDSNESKLAIFKLLHNKLCPCCGNKSIPLYTRAIDFIKDHNCPLCGTDQKASTEITPGLEAELGEKLQQKVSIEKEFIKFEKELDRLDETAIELNLTVNNTLLNRAPSVIYLNKSSNYASSEDNIENLKYAYQNLVGEKNDFQIQFDSLKAHIEKEYESFNSLNSSRLDDLYKIYSNYAKEFLGIPCTLEPVTISDRLGSLNLLVPKFNNIIRESPTSCSEAQRFFLDIAFRVSLIELTNNLANFKGSFICETPENALDITYINNVADMFEIFSRDNKNTLLMTSNIQSGGIAQSLLSKVKGQDKNTFILNLIEIGNLSNVQLAGRELLDEEIQKILE